MTRFLLAEKDPKDVQDSLVNVLINSRAISFFSTSTSTGSTVRGGEGRYKGIYWQFNHTDEGCLLETSSV